MNHPLAQRAARIVAQITPESPADDVLRREVGADRELDPAQKRALVGAVFAYYRWLRWLDSERPLPARVEAALDLQRRFDKDPGTIKSEALLARALPDWAQAAVDLPDTESRVAWLRQLQRPPALWVRPQREFAPALARALRPCTTAEAGLTRIAADFQPPATALRYDGAADLFRSDEFKKGLFEIQDLASQIVGHVCAPQPGETWWDACCGEGGKTLHLADLMANQGLIWASDRNAGRLSSLRKRAARARVFNYRAVNWNGGPFPPTKTRFDGILVDAPCSGLGTWQRNPHARWTTTENDVRELAAIQRQLLDNTWKSLKPGGRLVYAVCTVARAETTDVVAAFTADRPELEPIAPTGLPAGQAHGRFLWPHELDSNGMFVAVWRRR